MARRDGQYLVEDFFTNTDGLNTVDSPFVVGHNTISDGVNVEYVARGGFRRRDGHTRRGSADSDTRTIGAALWDKPGTGRLVIKASNTGAAGKLKAVDLTSYSPTTLTSDEASPSSTPLPNNTSIPVSFSMFNTSSAGILWAAGSAATNLYGVYSGTKFTANGSVAPTVSSPATFSFVGSGGNYIAGLYSKYMITFIKGSTSAESNATVLGKTTSASGGSDSATVIFSAATFPDVTKYTKMRVYRQISFAAFADNSAFTGGTLIAEITISGLANFNSGTITLTDKFDSITMSGSGSATNNLTGVSDSLVPNSGFVVLDNSPLPSGTFNVVTTWKRCLVTASNNTVYISDTNKPESWPLSLRFNIPSGGAIQALAVISASSITSSQIDEYLLIFKQNELWVVTGDPDPVNTSSLSLKFVDSVGAVGPLAVVVAEGICLWFSTRGVYGWNGNGKPIHFFRPIKDKLASSGDIDLTKAQKIWGIYKPDTKHVVFCVSSKAQGSNGSSTQGENTYIYKQSLEFVQGSKTDLANKTDLDGSFTPEILPTSAACGVAFYPTTTSTKQVQWFADYSGYVWTMYDAITDSTRVQPFEYTTQFIPLGSPFISKKVHRVLLYFKNNGPINLTMNYWSKYRFQVVDQSSTEFMSTESGNTASSSIWGATTWGSGLWAASISSKTDPAIFELNNNNNNSEGDSFKFQFTNSDYTLPLEFIGFSVYYTDQTADL